MNKQETKMSAPLLSATTGSRKEFDQNWKNREEAQYNHWVKGRPKNQIQLAFLSHWQVFNEVYPDNFKKPGKLLEVGCGRGSISSHFAENGWKCTLLDYSKSVLETAKLIFSGNQHEAEFVSGDARDLPIEDNSYDAVVSIGLLEHFDDIDQIINEQFRILKPGGVFLGYVVPERPDNVQRYFNWLNKLIRFFYSLFSSSESLKAAKEEVFRSDNYSDHYLAVINKLNVRDIKSFGMYPVPMVSHSPEFPFSLISPWAESFLAWIFKGVLSVRKFLYGRHGWICDEKLGQAFLVAFVKK